MAKLQLPRGVAQVEWKNKSDKSRQFRYRVRISRATFKCDKLFEDPQDAIRFLELTKTPEGREQIRKDESGLFAMNEAEKRAVDILEKSLDMVQLNDVVKLYIEKFVDKGATHPSKKRSEKINKDRLLNSCKTPVVYMSAKQRGMPAIFHIKPHLQQYAKAGAVGRKPLGEFYLQELSSVVSTDFVITRLKTVAKSTVKREITQLATVINKMRFFFPNSEKYIKGNPFADYDKSLLKNAEVKRSRRLTDQEEVDLVNALRSMRNPAMYQIAFLALSTGMRRSEVLFLQWDYIKDGYIELPDEATKAGSRRVMLNEDASSILKSVKRVPKEPRLFRYTIEGFKTNMSRAIKKAGLADFKFHDLRREHISRLIQMLATPNSIVLSELTGMKSVRHLQDAYIEQHEEQEALKVGVAGSIKQVMRSVGHSSVEMTQHYTTLKKP